MTRIHWTARTVTLALAAAAIVAPAALPLGVQPASAATTLPDPVVLYQEDFENTSTGTTLANYVSTTNMHYTADPDWLDVSQCNGFIVKSSEQTRPAGACTQSSNPNYSYDQVRAKARALGSLTPGMNPEENFALSTETAKTSPGTMDPTAVMFRTQTDLSLPNANGRFITFSVDAAATACQDAHPQLQFFLAQGTDKTAVTQSPIDPCSDPRKQTGSGGTSYGRFAAADAVLFSGSTLGVVLVNKQTSSAGNDGAIDNILILDATPRLAVAFSAPLVETGTSATLVLTVLNTSELSSKSGWGFSTALPAGLTVSGSASTTCGGVTTAASGGTTVSLTGGTLATGAETCTVTVPVTSSVDGSYTLAPAASTGTALNAPASAATVQFASSDFSAAVAVDTTRAVAGDTATYTVTVQNTGSFAIPAAVVALDLTDVLDDATLGAVTDQPTTQGSVLTWSVPLAVGATKTVTAAVTVGEPGDGDGTLRATVDRPGQSGPCGSCSVTTQTAAYSATVDSERATILEGQSVTFRMVLENLGTAAFDEEHPIDVTFDLTDALDDATLVSNGIVAAAQSPVYSWSGPLAVGASTTLEVTMRANQPMTGDHRMVVVGEVGAGGECADECSSTVAVQAGPVVHTGGAVVTATAVDLVPIGVLALVALGSLGAVLLLVRRDRGLTGR